MKIALEFSERLQDFYSSNPITPSRQNLPQASPMIAPVVPAATSPKLLASPLIRISADLI
ncbi:MAG: hypothetical protein AAF892_09555 [Cyanobacteria bacterium P01_D01_bin.71]